MIRSMVGWVLTCYGDPVDEFDELDEAIPAADEHIRTCPQGAMPWATVVEWHPTDLGVWVSAANGGWLQHHLCPKDGDTE